MTAGLHDSCADHPTDERVRRRTRQPEPCGEYVPEDRADETREHDTYRDDARVDDSLGDRLGDLGPEDCKGDEVPERRPRDGLDRREHTRRHHRGDRVRGIVKPVHEVEQEGEGDHPDECVFSHLRSGVLYGDRLHDVGNFLDGVNGTFDCLDYFLPSQNVESVVRAVEQLPRHTAEHPVR